MNKQSTRLTLFYYIGMLFKSIGIITLLLIFGLIKGIGFLLWRSGSFITNKLTDK